MRFRISVVALAFLVATARAEEKSFDSNGARIVFLDEGAGEPVVLLHGFTQSATDMWGRPESRGQIFATLVKEYRIIAPDLRGHGKSDMPHEPEKYGVEMAEDVIRLLDHLKVKKAHVFGYSMGAWVAGKLLATHPERLSSVILGGSGPLLRPSKPFMDRFSATAESLEKGNGIVPLILAGTADSGVKMTPEQAATISKLALGSRDQKALAAVLRGMNGLEVTEEKLKATTVPALFLYGALEGKANVELIKGAIKALPQAEVMVFEKADHLSTPTRADFRAAVQKFLNKNRQ
jgi:pimeloyl-ACP methyl ester carboxylesterase